ARFRGSEVKTMGDGFLATFDGPARAVECARAIRDAARQLGLQVRSGVHTGEVEIRGDDVAGLGVVIAARVSALAEPGSVWTSRTSIAASSGPGRARSSAARASARRPFTASSSSLVIPLVMPRPILICGK